jgi:hypothetical protein
MKSSKSLEKLYEIINSKMGPIEAKNFVSGAVYNAVSELQENNRPVTESALEAILSELADDFEKAAKNHVA